VARDSEIVLVPGRAVAPAAALGIDIGRNNQDVPRAETRRVIANAIEIGRRAIGIGAMLAQHESRSGKTPYVLQQVFR